MFDSSMNESFEQGEEGQVISLSKLSEVRP